uniref:Protein OPI10 n=1 Tax=Aceria tosichella TaxID=561515 RepID=A0A6G1S5Q6_9ACAR
MSAQTFGIVIPGRPVDTSFQQVDANKFLITIQEAETINHLVIFLTGMLPPDTVGCIFFSLPDPNASPTWHYLGYLTNQKPSAIYKLSNLTQSKLLTNNGTSYDNSTDVPTSGIGFNYVQNYTLLVGQVGISIEPFTNEIAQLVPAIETTASNANLFTEFINKTVGNLYNYCLSFSKTAEELAIIANPFQQHQAGNTDQYVPLKCIQNWYENYTRRLSNDQNFWKTLSG